ncbi:hypothetical protein D3C76_1356530 [compost metagenome]
MEQPLAKCHTHDGRQQAFADRPGQVRRVGCGGLGVAFVDELAIMDDHQGVGADALTGSIIPEWKGVGFQGLQGWAGRRQGYRPVFAGPGLGIKLGGQQK